ncbi:MULTISPECIES: MOSC domain-containing protein [Achromobacter]|uniref:Protein YiiM n=2 Tax=Achromobacter piechaudii TaxID=72556 RepID=A0A6S7EJ87_9BURK|nr:MULTISPECIES: MOSC domain-containing protein [Achromobacter]EFF76454.1 MOSC domain protein [Achromobacter piechaudii ATCC 43553]KNY12157.1 molybdenum cofactor sulfurase [Achromobacter piechaudii]MPS79092.1 MOSC domain-containing protein [Achromobacter sp.]CAB3910154.1 Protein YiiM [Achromobacter piechaudii]
MTPITIDALLTGTVRPLGDSGRDSGIDKHPVSAPLWLGAEGLRGDEQADRRFHGGPEKALHHYARDHYPGWLAELGERAVLAAPGAFGENISTSGLTEADVCVGDVFRAGTALIQVSQARQPCWKLDHRFGQRGMAARVQASGRTGWYYRVLQEGWLCAGDTLALCERPHPQWSLARVQDVLNRRVLDADVLHALAALPELSPNWRALFEKRAQAGQVEDWTRRLEGDAVAVPPNNR